MAPDGYSPDGADTALAGRAAARPGRFHDAVGPRVQQALVPVREAHPVRRPAVVAPYLDDLREAVPLTDDLAADVQPVADVCLHADHLRGAYLILTMAHRASRGKVIRHFSGLVHRSRAFRRGAGTLLDGVLAPGIICG